MAQTDFVLGECYWEVSVGEQAFAWELVAPPKSINVDQTQREATVTLGEMLPRDAVAKAFGLKEPLPYPQGVASAQVNPWKARASSAWRWAAAYAVALIGVFIAFSAMTPSGHYLDTTLTLPPDAKSGSPEAMAFSRAVHGTGEGAAVGRDLVPHVAERVVRSTGRSRSREDRRGGLGLRGAELLLRRRLGRSPGPRGSVSEIEDHPTRSSPAATSHARPSRSMPPSRSTASKFTSRATARASVASSSFC